MSEPGDTSDIVRRRIVDVVRNTRCAHVDDAPACGDCIAKFIMVTLVMIDRIIFLSHDELANMIAREKTT